MTRVCLIGSGYPSDAHAGPSPLVEEVLQVLLELMLLDELRNHESGVRELAIRTDGADSPPLALALRREDAPKDVEAQEWRRFVRSLRGQRRCLVGRSSS